MSLRRKIAVCGGGASAVLFVTALRRVADSPIDVTILDRSDSCGRGVAYGSTSDEHLLNVPAARMSAIADDPDHFLRWLTSRADGARYSGRSFASRRIYGEYLQELLRQARADRTGQVRVDVVHGNVTALQPAIGGWRVDLEDGSASFASAVVVATGNEPPRRLPVEGHLALDGVINDPWDDARKAAISRDANVMLVGSGLTAIDVALELLGRGHRGQICMLSRHGLLPRAHSPALVSGTWLFPPYPSSVAVLMRRIRDEAVRIPGLDGWRTAVDAMRPNLPAIWAALTPADRARFLRHVRPHWEVHRHRMAPEIAARLQDHLASGSLAVDKGRLARIRATSGHALELTVRRHGQELRQLADIVVNCTGPECNPAVSSNQLISSLLADGLARPDPLRLGLDTDADERLVAADGKVHESLYAVGPAARGRLWEVTAIPEIRVQAVRLSRHISPPVSEMVVAYTI